MLRHPKQLFRPILPPDFAVQLSAQVSVQPHIDCCQEAFRSEGGPLPMVCRENPASSIAIGLARSGSWLDDAQMQSVVHHLRHEFSDHQPPPGWNRDAYIARELARWDHDIAINPTLRRERRAGLRNRLARAQEQTGSLRSDVLWAMSRLTDGVRTAEAALDARVAEIAGQHGMSMREARAQLLLLRTQAPSGRQP